MKHAEVRAAEQDRDRSGVRRRADEALVAAYIHELSARHRARADTRRTQPAVESDR